MSKGSDSARLSDRPSDASLDGLIDAARAGSHAALDALQQQLAARFWRRPGAPRRRSGRDPAWTESDVVQEAIARVRECFEQFQGRTFGELVAWTRTILIRCRQERDRNYRTRNSPEHLQRVWEALRARLERDDAVRRPEAAALRGEALERLDKLLSRLGPDEQCLLALRVCERCSWQEIAEATQRNKGAARKSVQRTIMRLKRWFDEDDDC